MYQGGQKQRLLHRPRTAEKAKGSDPGRFRFTVDTKTDASIQRSFAAFIPDTTKIIIAQRVSSVQHADGSLSWTMAKLQRAENMMNC